MHKMLRAGLIGALAMLILYQAAEFFFLRRSTGAVDDPRPALKVDNPRSPLTSEDVFLGEWTSDTKETGTLDLEFRKGGVGLFQSGLADLEWSMRGPQRAYVVIKMTGDAQLCLDGDNLHASFAGTKPVVMRRRDGKSTGAAAMKCP